MKNLIILFVFTFVIHLELPAKDKISVGDARAYVVDVFTNRKINKMSSQFAEHIPANLTVHYYLVSPRDYLRIGYEKETNKVKFLSLISTPGQYSLKGSRVQRELEFIKFESDGYIMKVLKRE